MKLATPFLVLLAVTLSGCLNTGHSVNAYVGGRNLENGDFEALATEEQTVYGFDGVLALSQKWLAVETGWLHSSEDGAGNEVDVDEYFVGLRLAPWKILIEPYGAIGATFLDGTVDTGMASDDDSGLAAYVRAGAAMSFGLVRFGLDLRTVVGSDVEFSNLPSPDTDLDYYQVMIFAGVSL